MNRTLAIFLCGMACLLALGSRLRADGYSGYYPATQHREYQRAENIYIPVAFPQVLFQFVSTPTTPPPIVTAAVSAPARAIAVSAADPKLTLELKRLELEIERLKAVRQGIPTDHIPMAAEMATIRPAPSSQPLAGSNALSSAINILKENCFRCHSGTGKGGITIFRTTGEYSPNVPLEQILSATLTGGRRGQDTMPPGHPLPAAEQALFKQLLGQR